MKNSKRYKIVVFNKNKKIKKIYITNDYNIIGDIKRRYNNTVLCDHNGCIILN